MPLTVSVNTAIRALHSSDKREAAEFINGAHDEIERLQGGIAETINMIANCAGVSNRPDSLPQMVLTKLRALGSGI